LQQLGAEQLHFLVPNREKHGYGLTPKIVELALEYKPNLLITTDNGISSITGVEAAKRLGIKVLVTDHHLPSRQTPDADAVIDPKQADDDFPSKNLCGAGVIFYVMLALRTHLREIGWFSQQNIAIPNLANLLDLVALGTVADVVKLDYNNRILIDQGLKRIRAKQCCAGILALLQVSNRDVKNLVASDLAFAVAPRLNAAGRMDDMTYGIGCLLSENTESALKYAEALDNFNQERRGVEEEMQQEAWRILNRMTLNKQSDLPIGVCLFDENWHQGVIGILASRIKSHLNRPVMICADAGDGIVRGSGRSIVGVHIRDVIERIAAQYPNMIVQFGGHAMAAGLSFMREQLESFKKAFDTEVRNHVSEADLEDVIYSDGALSADDFNLKFAQDLRTITPWGHEFPEPLFDGHFNLLNKRILKGKHLKMEVSPAGSRLRLDAIAFNVGDIDWSNEVTQVNLVYRLDINTFRGFTKVQLLAEYVEPC